jgi:arylsulfatase A-like enzyme
MTGWYPHVRGHRTLWHLLRPDEPNLLRYLKHNSYDIQWFGKNDLLSKESFAESVTKAASYGSKVFNFPYFSPEDPHYHSFLAGPFLDPLEDHSDYANVMAAIQYLQGEPKGPFLIYLPLAFPHPPYGAPEPWHNQIDPDAVPDLRPWDLANKPAYFDQIRRSRGLDALSERDFRTVNARYLGMVGFIDHLFGMLMNALAESGHEDDTTVFFFSDHGDYAGDYGLVEKWPNGMEDVLTRVPLIVRTPGGIQGHAVLEPIEMFDVMATVLELAGISPNHTHFARSLVPQLYGAVGDPNRAVFAEGGYALHEPHCFEGRPDRDYFARDPSNIYYPKGKVQQDAPDSVGRTVMLRTLEHKLVVRTTGVSELYDLNTDPKELNNIYNEPSRAEIRQQLENQMLSWLIQTSDVTPFDMDPRGLK